MPSRRFPVFVGCISVEVTPPKASSNLSKGNPIKCRGHSHRSSRHTVLSRQLGDEIAQCSYVLQHSVEVLKLTDNPTIDRRAHRHGANGAFHVKPEATRAFQFLG
jgi:hypothetical protein